MASGEAVYLEDGGILITNVRAVFGRKAISMDSVNSVFRDTEPCERGIGLALLIFSLLFCSPAILLQVYDFWQGRALVMSIGSSGNRAINLAFLILESAIYLFMVGAGVLFTLQSRPTYTVKIRSAAGEICAYASRNSEYVDLILNAMKRALVERGSLAG